MSNLEKINGMEDGMVSWKLGTSILVSEHIRHLIMVLMKQTNYHLVLEEDQFQFPKIGNLKTCSKIIGDLLTNLWVKKLKLKMITLMD